jgi:hypothetical protein
MSEFRIILEDILQQPFDYQRLYDIAPRLPRRRYTADPIKKAARKRQKKARAITRRKP